MRRRMFTGFKLATLLTTAAGLAAFSANAQSQTSQAPTGGAVDQAKPASANHADRKTTSFIKQVAEDNDTEIAFGEMGARQAQNANLKSFASQLQRDHTQANQELQPIAQKYGVTLNQQLKRRDNRIVTKLQKDTGTKFDQDFATEALRMHQKDIEKFQKAASDIQEPDVRQYAESMLPKLREHFQHAQSVAKEVGVDQATISSIVNKLPAAVGGTGQNEEQNTGTGEKSQQGSGAKKLQSDSSKTPQ